MKTILLNTFDKGGAGVAAYRLHTALNNTDSIDAQLMYLHGSSNENSVHIYANGFLAKKIALAKLALEKLPFASLVKDKDDRFRFSTATQGYNLSNNSLIQKADIIHLHWINNGFLSVEDIGKLKKLNKPIVWTMHDMWAMTGGCHHSRECENYQKQCGNCFYLKNPTDNDISNKVNLRKQQAYNSLDITFIACSNWLAQRARKSGLLGGRRVEVLPNPIDTNTFKPTDKIQAKEKYGLANDSICISFVAADVGNARKGFEYLRKALWLLKEKHADWGDKIKLLVMGEEKTDVNLNMPFDYTFTGYLTDEERIINFYNASDVFVLPSLEENLPNTIMEALSCGVPSVAFEVGGIPDLIDHKANGYLAKYMDVSDLANGIELTILESQNSNKLQTNAREKAVTNYDYKIIAPKVEAIYKSIVKK
jgi:glycosyltransferase involved in cell wall biosynthesis